jgi:hypothetical protein
VRELFCLRICTTFGEVLGSQYADHASINSVRLVPRPAGRASLRKTAGALVCGLHATTSPAEIGYNFGNVSGATIMIRNGLYLASTKFLDGVEAHNRHVMVLRDGKIRGGGPFFYTVGSYTCFGSNWKGEMTSQEHTPIVGTHPWARKIVNIGFTGTYSEDGAELHATALVGKRSFRFGSIYRLLVAD